MKSEYAEKSVGDAANGGILHTRYPIYQTSSIYPSSGNFHIAVIDQILFNRLLLIRHFNRYVVLHASYKTIFLKNIKIFFRRHDY